MFQPQPTPFSTFYPSYFAGPLDSFPQQPLPPPPQQQPEEDGLQVNDDSYGPPQAQAQAQAQVLADGQETIRTGGFSYQQPSFAHPHAGAGGLEYQSGAVIAPCPGAGPGSTGGGPSVNPGEPGLGGPGPGPGPGPGAAAGVAHARAIAAGAGGDLSPPVQLQQQAAGPEVQVAMRFPSLHGAIPHPQHPLPAATRNLFDHTPSSALHRTRTQRQHQFRSIPHRHRHRQRPIPGSKMEPDQSLQDDLAAQEAAARTWQPELEVRRNPSLRENRPVARLICTLAVPCSAVPAITQLRSSRLIYVALRRDPAWATRRLLTPSPLSMRRPIPSTSPRQW